MGSPLAASRHAIIITMADPGSPRGSEASAIDLTFALEAAGETQPQRAADKASGEWLPFTAAGDTPTYAAAVSPTHASPLRRPRSRGVNTVSFDAAPDLGVLGGFRKCVNCDRAATRWCSRATWPSWAAPDESKARDPRACTGSPLKRRAEKPACPTTGPIFCDACAASKYNGCEACGALECDACARDTAAPAAFAKYCAAETRKAADAGDYPAAPIRPHAFRALRPRPCDACGKTKCVACYRECRICHKIVCVACVSAKPYLFRKDLSACERCVYDADALESDPCHGSFRHAP